MARTGQPAGFGFGLGAVIRSSAAAVAALPGLSDLLVTESIATLICRRIARDGQARLGAAQFTVIEVALAPLSSPRPPPGCTSPGHLADSRL